MEENVNSSSSRPWWRWMNMSRSHHEDNEEGNISYIDFYLHQPPVAAAFIISYLFIFLLCMVGNGVVCFIVLTSKHMRTVTNLFILNLAISDLLVGIFCMPTTLLDNIIAGWPFGSTVCKMSGMIQGISVSASVFTLVAIAVDRFRCIVHPFKQKLTITTAIVIIVVIWVLAIAIMCPSAIMSDVIEDRRFMVIMEYPHQASPIYWCRENWPNPEMRRIYTTVLFTNIYLAPLSLIVIMYARISIALFKNNGPAGSKHGHEHRQGVSRKKQKVIKMLIIIALLFTLSWLPLWTLMMLSDYANLTEIQSQVINIYVYPFAHWLAFFNSSVNPIIYGFFNENFRRGFQAALKLQICFGETWQVYSQRAERTSVLQARNHTQVAPGQVTQNTNFEMQPLKNSAEHPLQQCIGGEEPGLMMEDLEKVTDYGHQQDAS